MQKDSIEAIHVFPTFEAYKITLNTEAFDDPEDLDSILTMLISDSQSSIGPTGERKPWQLKEKDVEEIIRHAELNKTEYEKSMDSLYADFLHKSPSVQTPESASPYPEQNILPEMQTPKLNRAIMKPMMKSPANSDSIRQFEVGTNEKVTEPKYQKDTFDHPQNRKIFIGGLRQEHTKEMLSKHFSKYGKIADAVVMYELKTGVSRGFGFVVFDKVSGMEAALSVKLHFVEGYKVDAKKAVPAGELPLPTKSSLRNGPGYKLILSRVKDDIHTVDDLRTYFGVYGTLDQIEILPDGTGSIIYADKEAAEICVAHNLGRHILNDHMIEVTRPIKDMNYIDLYENLYHHRRGLDHRRY